MTGRGSSVALHEGQGSMPCTLLTRSTGKSLAYKDVLEVWMFSLHVLVCWAHYTYTSFGLKELCSITNKNNIYQYLWKWSEFVHLVHWYVCGTCESFIGDCCWQFQLNTDITTELLSAGWQFRSQISLPYWGETILLGIKELFPQRALHHNHTLPKNL